MVCLGAGYGCLFSAGIVLVAVVFCVGDCLWVDLVGCMGIT